MTARTIDGSDSRQRLDPRGDAGWGADGVAQSITLCRSMIEETNLPFVTVFSGEADIPGICPEFEAERAAVRTAEPAG